MVILREDSENFEVLNLSVKAQRAIDSKGRRLDEEKCPLRTDYQRDRDRILHSKAFRRLKHKTQVFLSPEGDHYRTRMTHTLEVSQISRTISRALNLNSDLTEAIALGHDLGHTPFGHCGEMRLNQIHPTGFKHNEQSLRVVDYLERTHRNKYGLNLTYEVRDGILNHNGEKLPETLEGQVVKICDRIAYLNHDIDDAIRAGVLIESDIPLKFIDTFGDGHGKRINTMIMDLILYSDSHDTIAMSPNLQAMFSELRAFMFENVYLNKNAKNEEERAESIVESLYNYYLKYPEKLPDERYQDYRNGEGIDAVKDYVASMSDRFAVNLYKDIFIPKFWLY